MTNWYLIESISPIAIIVVENSEIYTLNQFESSLIWILESIQGENYKVTNSLTDEDKDEFTILENIMTDEFDWCAIVKIWDIYRTEQKDISFSPYISELPNITEFELTITEYNESKDSTIDILSKIPKNLNIQINININSESILYDIVFWKLIIEFSSFNLWWLLTECTPEDEIQILRHDIFKRIVKLPFDNEMSAQKFSKLLAGIISKLCIV